MLVWSVKYSMSDDRRNCLWPHLPQTSHFISDINVQCTEMIPDVPQNRYLAKQTRLQYLFLIFMFLCHLLYSGALWHLCPHPSVLASDLLISNIFWKPRPYLIAVIYMVFIWYVPIWNNSVLRHMVPIWQLDYHYLKL